MSPAVGRPRWIPAYVALGSNLDDPARQVRRAFDALAALPQTRFVARSALYRSRPLGPVAQPDFVNAAAGLLTQLDAVTLLRELKALETRLGRATPVMRWGPRLIDLDLLVHGATQLQDAGITVPHPGVGERAFVLAPLAEIDPQRHVPGQPALAELLAMCRGQAIERLGSAPVPAGPSRAGAAQR